MANSLASLLSGAHGTVRFVPQADRRHVPDRRRIWRGGRRFTDRQSDLGPPSRAASPADDPRSRRD